MVLTSPDFLAAMELQIEFAVWRRRQGLLPTDEETRRLIRWTALAARQTGLVYARWAEKEQGER